MMTLEQKGRLIGAIVSTLKFVAKSQDKPFSDGETFLALAFRSDAELEKIARLAGMKV